MTWARRILMALGALIFLRASAAPLRHARSITAARTLLRFIFMPPPLYLSRSHALRHCLHLSSRIAALVATDLSRTASISFYTLACCRIIAPLALRRICARTGWTDIACAYGMDVYEPPHRAGKIFCRIMQQRACAAHQ